MFGNKIAFDEKIYSLLNDERKNAEETEKK